MYRCKRANSFLMFVVVVVVVLGWFFRLGLPCCGVVTSLGPTSKTACETWTVLSRWQTTDSHHDQ